MPERFTDDAIAATEWQDICCHLDSMGLLSKTDETAIELYAATYSRYRQAEEKVEQFGDVILSPNKGYPQLSPYFSARNKYLADCRAFLIEFGLTPSGRSRMRQKQ